VHKFSLQRKIKSIYT